MKKTLFTTRDLVLIALMAAIGLAVKPLIKTFFHFITTPLGIPGGTLAGGFYMMWLTLAIALTGKFGAATMVGLVQGAVAMVLGLPGSHGFVSIFTFGFPGLAADYLALLYRRRDKADGQMLYCLAANLTGTWLVGWLIMRLPKAPLVIALSLSMLSGVLGGLLAYFVYKEIKRYRLV